LSKKDDNDGRAEPGRPNQLSPMTRIDTAHVRPVQSAAGRSFIEPGSPWQNSFVESFGSRRCAQYWARIGHATGHCSICPEPNKSIWWVRKKTRVISQMATAVVMDSRGFQGG
jgi:hypothetical protein